jgi:hypothetical protein
MTLLLRCGAVAFGRPPTGPGRTRERTTSSLAYRARVWAFVLSPRRSRFWLSYKSRRATWIPAFELDRVAAVSPAS